MTKAREIAELGQKLTVDASGNLDIAGDVTADRINVGDQAATYIIQAFDNSGNTPISFGLGEQPNTARAFRIEKVDESDADPYAANIYFSDHATSNTGSLNFFSSQEKENILRLNANGNIGMGTNSPNYKLVVSNGGAAGIEFGPEYAGDTNLVQHYDRTANAYMDVNHIAQNHRFGRGSSEWMRITNTGKVGLGNSIPDSFYTDANDLVVGSASGSNGMTIYTSTTGVGAIYFADGTTGSDEYRGGIAYAHDASDPNENLALVSGGETKMRIRTTGYAELASASQIRLTLGNAGTAGTNTANWIRGTGSALGLNAASDNIHFEIGGTERMRIQGANVGIGTSSPSSILHIEGNTNAFTTAPILYFGSTSAASAEVRDWAIGPADDNYGNFHIFRGTSTGSNPIGHDGKVFTIASSGKVGIGISSPARQLHIGASDNTNHDAVIRLNSGGATGSRAGIEFHYETASTARARLSVNASTLELEADINGTKVAAFDGDGLKMTAGKGIKFDAYGSGNILDDYEEGTWSPTITGNSGAFSQTYTQQSGRYTKIGNYVYLTYDVHLSDAGSPQGTYMVLGGLPFTAATGNHGGSLTVAYHVGWQSLANDHIGGYISGSNAYLVNGSNDYIRISDGNHTSSSRLIGSAWFVTS